MDTIYYLEIFKNAANLIDKKQLAKHGLELSVGLYDDSVFLKLYKLSWTNKNENPLTAETRIFFSVWISDFDVTKDRLPYNIHALKLRKLQGYHIESKKFADNFRLAFKQFEQFWPNVSTNFGPLTLMQGWEKMESAQLETQIAKLALQFLDIEHLIDDTLTNFKKTLA